MLENRAKDNNTKQISSKNDIKMVVFVDVGGLSNDLDKLEKLSKKLNTENARAEHNNYVVQWIRQAGGSNMSYKAKKQQFFVAGCLRLFPCSNHSENLINRKISIFSFDAILRFFFQLQKKIFFFDQKKSEKKQNIFDKKNNQNFQNFPSRFSFEM